MSKRIKSLIFPVVLVAGLAVFVLTGRNSATGAEYTFDGEPEIVAATFSSAWCSTCKILKPRLAKIIPEFSDKPVKFVELDFTLGQRTDIADQAAAEGLGEIYPRFEGATGFTLLVDKDTGKIVDMLTINHNERAMRAAIAQSIAVASRADTAPSE
ncbi:MAG: thioredoxin domain-containing protein [Pseudomonadota bacterium]